MALSTGLIVFQVFIFFEIKDLNKKSSDHIGVLFLILNLLTNIAVGLVFGKPYTPIIFSTLGALISLGVSLKFPGLWEWFALLSSATTPFLLSVQYFWIGLWCRRRTVIRISLRNVRFC